MIQETFYSNGKNEFEDNIYRASEWSAPIMVSKEKIIENIAELNLEQRVIKDIKIISQAYNFTREWIELYAYNSLESLEEEDRQAKSAYHAIDPETLYPRCVIIDEPLLIMFEDNEQFEIDTPQMSEFRLRMNCIPSGIRSDCNSLNVEVRSIFDICIGKAITSVEVVTHITKNEPMFSGDFEDGKERELVSAIILWLENDVGICIEPVIDYCEVTLINSKRELLKIPMSQLKKVLFNWEDIHEDEELGFESKCRSFWFGKKGIELMDNPNISFTSERKEHFLHIHEDDFALFYIAISAVIGELHDTYEDYEFSSEQWEVILREIDRIIAFSTFDELFDYIVSLKEKTNGKCNLLYYINNNGVKFWKNKWLHEYEAKDIRKWTELVRKPGEKILVIGY
ncbi:MAG: hypothetical protein Q4C46_08835 [Bacillota bacterium]|nr:hypothetical protein [Bacillota bacterium]